MKVLGIMPVRSGSKGLPGKNIRVLNGRPLMEWAGMALLNSKGIDRAICSTDDILMADVARNIGLEVPFLRPKNLADDEAKVVDVICHALEFFSKKGEYYSHVALVQATSPTVSHVDIEAAINIAKTEKVDTVISGYEVSSHHPNLMFTVGANNRCAWYCDDKQEESRRQDFSKIYIRTGLVYIVKADLVAVNKTIYGPEIGYILVEEDRSIAIDVENDFLRAENWMKRNE